MKTYEFATYMYMIMNSSQFRVLERDTRVKEGYMNELRLHSNENLKELKVITYINKVHFSFRWLWFWSNSMLGDFWEFF